MNRKASLWKILTVDYVSFLALIFPIVSVAMYGVIAMQGPAARPLWIVFVVLAGISLGILVWRAVSLRALIEEGHETNAEIHSIGFFRDRGRVDYIYPYRGQKYQSGNAIMKTRSTKALQQGSTVVVIVDPNNPKRSLIRDLYCSKD